MATGRELLATSLLCLLVQLTASQQQLASLSLSEAPSSVAVSSENGEVFIAAGTRLLRLSRDLDLLETAEVGGELARIALSPDEGRLVGCLAGDTRTCFVFDTSSLGAGATATVENAHYNPENGLAIVTTTDSFYLGSEGGIGMAGANDNIFIAQYNYTSETVRTTGSVRFRVQNMLMRQFYGGVSRNGYIYYFVADQGSGSAIRVLRMCDCARVGACTNDEFRALYELIIECRSSATDNSRVCGVDLVESFAGQAGPLVVVTRCEDAGDRNRACAFRLADIDSDMDAYLAGCRTGGEHSESDLAWETSRSCSQFTGATTCDFGIPPGINVEETNEMPSNDQRLGFYLVNIGTPLITASLAIVVDGVSLLYVAHSGVVGVYQAQTTSINNPTGMEVERIENVTAVRDISWQNDSDYITITTDDQVLLYPLERCGQSTTCQQCTAVASPLCGWCSVEDKCSTSSQCQSSSQSGRWVTSSDQCLSVTVSPSQFILDSPTILNVTVEPGLPEGLTYNCSFSATGDKFPLIIPAFELVASTQYQCDITEVATSLDSVQLVTNFSFVAVEIGIPFATSVGALTIFNCSVATSCVECLETEGACGWCLYGQQCSGVPEPCPEPAGVNNSYLTLEGSATDVCPVVNAASTPSGHYTQPVGVARDLILQTSNLPPPVEGFRYECRINETKTFSASLNTTSNTVNCTIPAGTLQLSSAELIVPLQLIWTNKDTISYPLNELNENSANNTMCILYNCKELENSCSSCLGLNLENGLANGFTCGWCSTEQCAVIEECTETFSTMTSGCPAPTIASINPSRGPREGGTRVTITGTNLGAEYSQVMVVLRRNGAETECQLGENDTYVPGREVVCITPSLAVGMYMMVVEIQRGSDTVEASDEYSVEEPVLTGVEPLMGPKSGGIEVMVSGENLAIGNRDNTTVQLSGVNCNITQLSNSMIVCTSGEFTNSSTDSTADPDQVVVFIDNAEVTGDEAKFTYRDDPVFLSVSPQMVIPAGGIQLTFTGENLDVVTDPPFLYTDSRFSSSLTGGSCSLSEENREDLVCIVPWFETAAGESLPDNVDYTVVYGAAPGPNTAMGELVISARPNPVFKEDSTALSPTQFSPGSGAALTITGSNLDSVEIGEITVTIGGEICEARISEGQNEPNNTYTCFVPKDPPEGMNEAVVLVNVGRNLTYGVGTVTYTEEDEASQLPIIIGGAAGGGLFVFLLLVMFIVICCFMRRASAKEKRFTTLLAQMELWESEMADECKRAFTELQTDLADLVQISDDKNLPYRDFRSFAMRFLFPSAGPDHPVLNPLAVADSTELVPHLQTFHQLILDKKFLLLFVRTLEAQQGRFTLQDKCNVASLLMVAFQNDLDYATEILQTLLSDVMHQAVLKSHPKLLLRRTETVAEKMLANWLCFLLFPYLLEHAGEPLFILYRAIKSQLEKGPVDVITGEARHSLSEEKLLRQKFEPQVVDGVVETEGGEQVAVKLLDCDTITQAKEKILDVLYKNTAISHRPQLLDVDLELCRGHAGIPLRDHDSTNVKEGDWIKINTLGHYRLAEMSQAAIDNPKNPVPRFKLVPRHERPVSGISFDHVGTIIANLSSGPAVQQSGPHVFHLVKPEQGEEVDGGTGPRHGRILSEVFLTRLLSTKRILQPYVDDLFKGIFAVPRGKPLAKAIKFLYDFLDLQAAELGIQDPEILHTWKTNSLFLRFWVSLIKNPDFVFDIHKSATVDACLTIIAQAYIDACSTSEIKYNKNTPSAKLLYVNEVRSYRQDVQQYYSAVQSLPKLSPYDMAEYLRETAQVCSLSVQDKSDNKHIFMTRQLYFVTESALYELFKFAATYSSELQDALNDEGLSVMATKLEKLQAAIKV